MTESRTRILTEIALTIALAAVLNALKLWRMPQGGTISLVMLPLFVLAVRRGPIVGLVAGALYGVVDFLIDPYPPVHWAQYLLDYPVAYLMCGLAGIAAPAWRNAVERGRQARAVWTSVVPAIALGATARWGVHWLSGVVFFGAYAPEGQPVWLYSLVYNSYVPLSAILCATAALAVLPVLSRVVPVAGSRQG
ncbi:MAG: energy-coupled thiamine transporter ThiT [Anaerosomatales bacterium]|nr:energy-coupled thiamine transporter ThiT [Anaerosomatales bacterium]